MASKCPLNQLGSIFCWECDALLPVTSMYAKYSCKFSEWSLICTLVQKKVIILSWEITETLGHRHLLLIDYLWALLHFSLAVGQKQVTSSNLWIMSEVAYITSRLKHLRTGMPFCSLFLSLINSISIHVFYCKSICQSMKEYME